MIKKMGILINPSNLRIKNFVPPSPSASSGYAIATEAIVPVTVFLEQLNLSPSPARNKPKNVQNMCSALVTGLCAGISVHRLAFHCTPVLESLDSGLLDSSFTSSSSSTSSFSFIFSIFCFLSLPSLHLFFVVSYSSSLIILRVAIRMSEERKRGGVAA